MISVQNLLLRSMSLTLKTTWPIFFTWTGVASCLPSSGRQPLFVSDISASFKMVPLQSRFWSMPLGLSRLLFLPERVFRLRLHELHRFLVLLHRLLFFSLLY